MLTLAYCIASDVKQLNKRGKTLHKEGSTVAVGGAVNNKGRRSRSGRNCCISGGFPTGEDLTREILYHEAKVQGCGSISEVASMSGVRGGHTPPPPVFGRGREGQGLWLLICSFRVDRT